jgi:hypothetical protein
MFPLPLHANQYRVESKWCETRLRAGTDVTNRVNCTGNCVRTLDYRRVIYPTLNEAIIWDTVSLLCVIIRVWLCLGIDGDG